MVFVGGIPFGITPEEFEEEVKKWGQITKKYLQYPGGWGTATVQSDEDRDLFLKEKSRHIVGGKSFDVKPYIYNKTMVDAKRKGKAQEAKEEEKEKKWKNQKLHGIILDLDWEKSHLDQIKFIRD